MTKIDSRDNVAVRMEGTRVVIEIETDPDKVQGATSSSGKSYVLATTGGAMRVGSYRLNLTLYQPR